ncbi:MAG: DUF3991 domain-containing protein [Clostridiales bacterium]|nr:DUF3991 domain-containing protein [Clostridiales bacterium]
MTKEQIERARQVDILDYILSHEPGNVRRVGSGYRLIDHESLSIDSGKWYWHSHGVGGRTALDYLTDVRGYGLVEAVCMLINERPIERGDAITPNAKPTPVKPNRTIHGNNNPFQNLPLTLPLRNSDNRRVIAYLQSRGIDKGLILDCIDRGVLYESKPYHNCVFQGKDENGKTRYAALRGTASGFKRDADGSDKRYGFILPPSDPQSGAVAAFEAPVDCLSHQTLCKEGCIPPFDGWRLSLGGTSILALEHFISSRAEVTHCLVCTDNDEAGEAAAAKIAGLPGITTERVRPGLANDWNDMLQSVHKEERIQKRTRRPPCL